MKHYLSKYVLIGALCSLTSLAGQAEDRLPSDSSAPTSEADNTEINKRDRSGETVTPIDQSNESKDLKVQASVRQNIVADDSLSTLAHNIKITNLNGVVTLRGPVASAAEKAKVAELAEKTPGVTEVNNELDIKQ